MVGMDDIQEAVAILSREVQSFNDLPGWAERRGIDREAVEDVLALAGAALGRILPDDQRPDDAPEDAQVVAIHPLTMSTLAQVFTLGVEIGGLRRVDTDDLPDPDNITTDAPND